MGTACRLIIRSEEFKASLKQALSYGDSHGGITPKFGLAISGGVDSMALAYMFRRYVDESVGLTANFKAFIVDHKARPESTREAKRVALMVNKVLGKQPSILELQWPSGSNPLGMPNFESTARRLRYQALGKICRANNITHLLLGHHADDLSETVLGRLAWGHKRHGLQGINSCAQIPHCEGLHSVYESGEIANTEALSFSNRAPYEFEKGGIQCARPLLKFSKDRLISTCISAGISWVDDPTNQDPQFTQRNSIRTLLKSSRLPVALRSTSLQALAHKCRLASAQDNQVVQKLMEACVIECFDIRSGRMQISLPKLSVVLSPQSNVTELSDRRRIAVQLIRTVLDTVSAREIINTRNFNILPSIFFPQDFPPLNDTRQTRYTYGGVLIEPLEDFEQLARDTMLSGSTRWQLTRQPYQRDTARPFADFTGDSTTSEAINENSASCTTLTFNQRSFKLWDGRYWISIKHNLPQPIFVVPLGPKHLDTRMYAGEKDLEFTRHLKKLIDDATSPANRWILPAIVTLQNQSNAAVETVVAAPTLGVVRPEWKDKLSWITRYKKISFETLRADSTKSYLFRSNGLA